MSANDDLSGFIQAAKDRGVADAFIVELLRQEGWAERHVYRAFSKYYAQTLGVTVPARSQGIEYARDAFYYLLNFISLGFWTIALGQISYVLVSQWFPDPTQHAYYTSLQDELSWQIATVLVTFPIFLIVHARIRRALSQRPDLYDSGVRKWLTYLALVLAAFVVVGDAVWFLDALLRGELSIRFLLDSLGLLVLGGGTFAYYLLTIDPPAAKNEAR